MTTAVSHGYEAGKPAVAIRQVSFAEIGVALKQGFHDMRAARTDVLMVAAIYPLAAVMLAAVFVLQGFAPLVFPICAGFALVGPMATLWFAARSRQIERGDEQVITTFTPERLIAIERLCAVAISLFVAWNVAAGIIYGLTLGSSTEDVNGSFLHRVFHTTAGLELIVIGCAVGAVFAVAALAVFFISFPLVLDRQVSAAQAIGISVKAMLTNPFFVLAWGVVVILGLVLGAIPVLLGIVVVLPTLGHASWHLYRKIIA